VVYVDVLRSVSEEREGFCARLKQAILVTNKVRDMDRLMVILLTVSTISRVVVIHLNQP
jgi:hypothetical protein